MRELTEARKELNDLRADNEALRRLTRTYRGTVATPGTPQARHKDAATKVVPKGYDTVLGFLAKWHPEILDVIDWHDPSATLRDGLWCMHRSKGSEMWAKAPQAMLEMGLKKVRAYPLEILKQRFE